MLSFPDVFFILPFEFWATTNFLLIDVKLVFGGNHLKIQEKVPGRCFPYCLPRNLKDIFSLGQLQLKTPCGKTAGNLNVRKFSPLYSFATPVASRIDPQRRPDSGPRGIRSLSIYLTIRSIGYFFITSILDSTALQSIFLKNASM